MTKRTMTNKHALRKELEKIKREGIAVSIGQAVPGAAGVAAPVLNADGSIAAALLVGAPVDRFQKELPLLRRLVKAVAKKVSGAIALRPQL